MYAYFIDISQDSVETHYRKLSAQRASKRILKIG